MILAENRKFTPLSAGLIVATVLAAVASYAILPWHFETCDVPYQIMTGWGDFRTTVVAPLSAWLTGVLGPLVDYDLMPMRRIGWTCFLITSFIGMIPAWQLSRNVNFTLGSGLLAIMLFWWSHCLEFELSWDCYAAISIMTTFALCVSHILRPSLWKIAVASALAAVTMWLRLPSAVAGLLPAIAVLYAGVGTKGKLCGLCIVTATYAAVALGLLLAMYGSVETYMSYWAENKISGHSTNEILSQYCNIGARLCFFIILCAGFYRVLMKGFSLSPGIRILYFVAMFAICIAVMKIALGLFLYFLPNPLFIATACLVMMKTAKSHPALFVVALLMLIASFTASLWSNLEFTRMMLYPFITVLVFLIVRSMGMKSVAVLAILWTAALIIGNDGNVLFHRIHPTPEETVDGNKHLAGFVILDRYRSQFRRIIDNFTPYASNPGYSRAVFRGYEHDYIFEYMFDAKTLVFSNHWDRDTLHYNKKYIDEFNKYLETLRPPTAILMLHRNMPKPPVAFDYEKRYQPVYSDSDFTIVIRQAEKSAAHAD